VLTPNRSAIALAAACGILIIAAPHAISAESVPDWVRNIAKLYGDGQITEAEFLNAIRYLIEHGVIVVEVQQDAAPKPKTATVTIPNGNSGMGNAGFYLPLNMEISAGTTVVWINDDVVPHTVQSQDGQGHVIGLFNSDALETGERFAHVFDEEGVYNYFCTLHPWRVGVVTVK